MTDKNPFAEFKSEILKDPTVILDDPEVMRALLNNHDSAKGENFVDLRGVFVERLEDRLDRLEDTHRTVIANAYENLAGTNQIHRAILAVLDADDIEGFLQALHHDVANILAVDLIRICLESDDAAGGEAIGPDGPLKEIIVALPANGVDAYVTEGRSTPARQVTLRTASEAKASVYGKKANDVRSEAILRLDLGDEKLPGMVIFGSNDENRFSSDQASDLLSFFAQALERILRHWVT